MGLEDLPGMDKDDNVGGRPPKEESDDGYGQEARGNPYTPDKDSEDYWDEIYDEFVSGDEPDIDEIARMADHAHVVPWCVVEKLDEYGIYEPKEDLWRDDYPQEDGATSYNESETVVSTGNTNSSDSGSGLKGLINKTK